MLFAGPGQVFKLRAFLTLLPGQSQARSADKLGRVKGLQVTGFRVFSFRVKDLGSFALHQALMGPTRARVQDGREGVRLHRSQPVSCPRPWYHASNLVVLGRMIIRAHHFFFVVQLVVRAVGSEQGIDVRI